MSNFNLKTELCLKSIEGYKEGLFAGTSGNLSIFDYENNHMLITPSGFPYNQMTPEDIVVLTANGNVVEGLHKPSSEWKMHLEIYKSNPEIMSVVHTHSPYATAFAVADKPIPTILIEMMFFLYGDVRVAKYQPPGSVGLGIEAAKLLKTRTACLLKNHGVVAVGKTLDSAYNNAVYVEDAAKICTHAVSLGRVTEIPMQEQNKIRRRMGITEE